MVFGLFGSGDNPVKLEKLSSCIVKFMRKDGKRPELEILFSGGIEAFYVNAGELLSVEVLSINNKNTKKKQIKYIVDQMINYHYKIGLYHAFKKLGKQENWIDFAINVEMFKDKKEQDYWRVICDEFCVSCYISGVLIHLLFKIYNLDESDILCFTAYYLCICEGVEMACYLNILHKINDGSYEADEAIAIYKTLVKRYSILKKDIEDGLSEMRFDYKNWQEKYLSISSFRKGFKK